MLAAVVWVRRRAARRRSSVREHARPRADQRGWSSIVIIARARQWSNLSDLVSVLTQRRIPKYDSVCWTVRRGLKPDFLGSRRWDTLLTPVEEEESYELGQWREDWYSLVQPAWMTDVAFRRLTYEKRHWLLGFMWLPGWGTVWGWQDGIGGDPKTDREKSLMAWTVNGDSSA